MQAAVVNVLGKPPRYQPFPEPEPHPDEVLIQVRAAGLHPIVKALASGTHYAGTGEVPMVPGVDGLGTLPDGSRVYFAFARKPWGTMSQRTVAPRNRCVPVPDGLEDALAAALPNPGMSAWLSLKERAGLVPGETVLIYTDGVSEAMNPQGELYTEKRVREFLRNSRGDAAQIGKALLADVRAHANGRSCRQGRCSAYRQRSSRFS